MTETATGADRQLRDGLAALRELSAATESVALERGLLNGVFAALDRIQFQGNYILQTARAADGDHGAALIRYRAMTLEWLARDGS